MQEVHRYSDFETTDFEDIHIILSSQLDSHHILYFSSEGQSGNQFNLKQGIVSRI